MTCVKVTCGACDGTGKRKHERMTQALHVLSNESWSTTFGVARCLDIGDNNAATVLARMVRMGLVERTGSGSGPGGPYKWRLTDAGQRLQDSEA